MQEILVLLQQLKSSLLNVRSILFSEPQLTPGRRSAMMMRIGRPNLLDFGMLKDIAFETRLGGRGGGRGSSSTAVGS